MPLRQKAEWTYEFNGKLQNGVEKMTVVGETSVAGGYGFLVQGPLGTSRLAWAGSKLVAAELAGVRYSPPIPLLDSSGTETLPDWKGEVRAYGMVWNGSRTATQRKTTFTLSGRKYAAIQVDHILKYGDRTIETTITFADSIGIAELNERTNGEFLSSIQYLAGP